MEWLFSLLALLATLFGFYLQRRESEKSQKPIPQIVFGDTERQIFVRVYNNGVGPLITDQLAFIKDGNSYTDIEECLDLDPKSYMHTQITGAAKKVIIPGSYLEVFSTRFEEHEGESDMDQVKRQLSQLTLKADCRDIYHNKITIERDLKWFSRHFDAID